MMGTSWATSPTIAAIYCAADTVPAALRILADMLDEYDPEDFHPVALTLDIDDQGTPSVGVLVETYGKSL